jgi:formylglycine-generating enzyme required for sulfatase activity
MIGTSHLARIGPPLLAVWLAVAGSVACGAMSIRLDCGGDGVAGGWRADSASAGGSRVQTAAVIAGCGKVPAAVFQSGRLGQKLSYSFPELPDGVYRVRLLFAEVEMRRRGERLFRLSFEKVVAVPVLDVVDRAAGRFKALRLSFLVTVSDGNGLQMSATGLKGAALLNGLEITRISPAGMALVPAGAFDMGDSGGEGEDDEQPVHRVATGAFFMDQTEVTQDQWNVVYGWALTQGYMFSGAYAKRHGHPVQAVDWDDCVKWCNARSEMEGRTPAYYTDDARTAVYRSGRVSLRAGWVRWDEGYRLPTEAEWEKAARGGSERHRFPWSAIETLQHARANYDSDGVGYDTSPTRLFHPSFDDGVPPMTAPAGSFAVNGYGLHDMAGNVAEWCWDWYGERYYDGSPAEDPTGPDAGAHRVFRGGGWNSAASSCRVAFRHGISPEGVDYGVGFRTVLPVPL